MTHQSLQIICVQYHARVTSMGRVKSDLWWHHVTFLEPMGLQGRARSHHLLSLLSATALGLFVDPVLGMLPNGMVGVTGSRRMGAGPDSRSDHYINFTRKQHTIEHHIWPHTDDAPNIDAVMSWCGARAVKTTHVEFRRQNVCTAAGRIERPQLLHESHMFLTICRRMPRF